MIDNTKKKKSFSNTMRSLHRDLGYFVIGLTLIYSLTGILLSGRALGWLEQEYIIIKTISSNIEKEKVLKSFSKELKKDHLDENIPSSILVDASRTMRHFKFKEIKENIIIYKARENIVEYNLTTGTIQYIYHSHSPFIKKFLAAHKASHKNIWFYLAILYSIILTFLAISAMFMVKGKFGFKKRGVYFMLAGIALVLVFLFFS